MTSGLRSPGLKFLALPVGKPKPNQLSDALTSLGFSSLVCEMVLKLFFLDPHISLSFPRAMIPDTLRWAVPVFQDTRGAFVSDVLTEMWTVTGALLSKKKS